MKIRFKPLCIVLLVCALPRLSPAGTYQWRDAAGTPHFTDNPDKIPLEYRGRTKEIPSAQAEQRQLSSAPAPPSAGPQTNGGLPSPLPGERETGDLDREKIKLGQELQKLQDGLPAKQKDLEMLRRKWTVSKGRTPTEKEKEDFEKKRAKGEVSDNPYINKNPLGAPGLDREAYFRKLEDVRKDEARIAQLRKELDSLNRKSYRPGI